MARGAWLYAFVTLAVSASVCGAEPVTLRLSLQVATNNPQLGVSVVQFKEDVERETQKSVLVEIFDKGRLYNDFQVLGAIQSGAVEMGMAGINQISQRLPAAEIIEQPFLFNFEALTRAAADPDRELRQVLDKAIVEALGVRVLWWQTGGYHVLFGRGGLDVADPERMRNRKVRVYSSSMAGMIERCGGVPQIISITKTLDALKDGSVDLAMSGVLSAETRHLWQGSDTITRTDIASMEWIILINEKSWQSLTDHQRTIIRAAARKAENDIREKNSKLDQRSWDWARNKGMRIQELTPDQVAEWRACSADLIDTYMRSSADLGQKLIAAYGKLRSDPCCSAGPPGAFNRR
ncbi:MAG TPA: TRAP transporter substrate-binding protein DctP [Hyphomicrobiaceae bacterium]|jgi:C4-dicarboxylate-binding protein DctP|nr:TRAP transporter substrate-binding protein DctP [Hyphomicrobiaceae bacterium]